MLRLIHVFSYYEFTILALCTQLPGFKTRSSKEKIKRFSYLAMDALRMAETLLLDVTVRTDGTIGRIRLSTDFFVLNEMCPEKARQIFVDMIKSADDFGIYAKDDLVVIEYIFRLTMTIPK